MEYVLDATINDVNAKIGKASVTLNLDVPASLDAMVEKWGVDEETSQPHAYTYALEYVLAKARRNAVNRLRQALKHEKSDATVTVDDATKAALEKYFNDFDPTTDNRGGGRKQTVSAKFKKEIAGKDVDAMQALMAEMQQTYRDGLLAAAIAEPAQLDNPNFVEILTNAGGKEFLREVRNTVAAALKADA